MSWDFSLRCVSYEYPILQQSVVFLSKYEIIQSDPRWNRAGHRNASAVNTLEPRANGRHFPDYVFKCIFLNRNLWISIKISLKLVPGGPINNIPALVQIMAGRRPGDKPLSEPMMFSLLTHICVTRPQWVKTYRVLLWSPMWNFMTQQKKWSIYHSQMCRSIVKYSESLASRKI